MRKIFIQSIADYHAGRIVGQWIDLDGMIQDDLWDAVKAILAMSKESNAEEWEIADYDGFYGLTPCFTHVLEIARLLDEHGEAYALYAEWVGESYADEGGFEESYCGVWKSFLTYASDLFDELYIPDIADNLRFYIDYEAWARDLQIDDYYWDVDSNSKVHVFRRG